MDLSKAHQKLKENLKKMDEAKQEERRGGKGVAGVEQPIVQV